MSEIILGTVSAIVLFLTWRTINKERFENTFFKLFEILQKLLVEITTWRENIDKDTMTRTKNTNDIEEARIKGEYSPRLRQFFNLLLQILKYIDKNKIKDEMAYVDLIRPLLSQEILDLPEKYTKNDDSSEYQRLVKKYSIHS